MPVEAEVISVTRPGDDVKLLVEFKKDGKSLGREIIAFSSNETVTSSTLQEKINIVGNRLDRIDTSDASSRGFIGTKFTVQEEIAGLRGNPTNNERPL